MTEEIIVARSGKSEIGEIVVCLADFRMYVEIRSADDPDDGDVIIDPLEYRGQTNPFFQMDDDRILLRGLADFYITPKEIMDFVWCELAVMCAGRWGVTTSSTIVDLVRQVLKDGKNECRQGLIAGMINENSRRLKEVKKEVERLQDRQSVLFVSSKLF